MSVPAVSRPGSSRTASAEATIRELQERVHRMQGTALTHPLETLPALRPLVQLQTGASYAVDSPLLAMALMAGPSSAGAWCGVVGVPEFGIEAAAALGVQPDRTVLVPEPGDAWMNVTAAMIDVLTVVVVRPPLPDAAGRATGPSRPGSRADLPQVTQHQAARLSSRLRQREATLIAIGDWPRSDARLRVTRTRWTGIGQGYGHLSSRRVTVSARRTGLPHSEAELWLPDEDAQVRLVEPEPTVLRLAGGEAG